MNPLTVGIFAGIIYITGMLLGYIWGESAAKSEIDIFYISLMDYYIKLDKINEFVKNLPCEIGTDVWSTCFTRVDDNGMEHPTSGWKFDLDMVDE